MGADVALLTLFLIHMDALAVLGHLHRMGGYCRIACVVSFEARALVAVKNIHPACVRYVVTSTGSSVCMRLVHHIAGILKC